MKTINLKAHILAVACIAGVLAFLLVIVIIPQNSAAAALAAVASLLCAFLEFLQYRKLKAARLILENRILHIQAAMIQDMASSDTDVYISCFGLLINGCPELFNRKSNRLRRVEIGRDYISLSWGTEKKPKSARLLHPSLDAAEIQKIAERFLFETGVRPVVAEDCK